MRSEYKSLLAGYLSWARLLVPVLSSFSIGPMTSGGPKVSDRVYRGSLRNGVAGYKKAAKLKTMVYASSSTRAKTGQVWPGRCSWRHGSRDSCGQSYHHPAATLAKSGVGGFKLTKEVQKNHRKVESLFLIRLSPQSSGVPTTQSLEDIVAQIYVAVTTNDVYMLLHVQTESMKHLEQRLTNSVKMINSVSTSRTSEYSIQSLHHWADTKIFRTFGQMRRQVKEDGNIRRDRKKNTWPISTFPVHYTLRKEDEFNDDQLYGIAYAPRRFRKVVEAMERECRYQEGYGYGTFYEPNNCDGLLEVSPHTPIDQPQNRTRNNCRHLPQLTHLSVIRVDKLHNDRLKPSHL
ncbi:unnamed protein product [Timema podura]|uniref:Uncharacterized protein n=1 Tax=Timema podura TaxID=61482 RepID=A0ABN7NF80_TIMPD|nr:unnamed protein product [Timema podura]